MRCSRCDSEIRIDSSICLRCGAIVDNPAPKSPNPETSQAGASSTGKVDSGSTKSKATAVPKSIPRPSGADSRQSQSTSISEDMKAGVLVSVILGLTAILWAWSAHQDSESTAPTSPAYEPPVLSSDASTVNPSLNSSRTITSISGARLAESKPPAETKPKPKSDPLVKSAQQILTELGYNPGPVDGLNGAKTTAAFIQFQRDYGIEVTGRIDQESFQKLFDLRPRPIDQPDNGLLGNSTSNRASNETSLALDSRSTPRTGDNSVTETKQPLHSPGKGSVLDLADANSIAIGSLMSAVLRLQGEPQNRAVYNEVDEEVWNYPGGQVTFSIRTQTVTHLNNYAHGLKVSNSSQKSNPSLNRNSVDQLPPDYFTIGSPKDDVLRLQGEPQNRAVYNEVDEEVWNYPGGQVTFSIRTQTVTHLNNYAHGLKVSNSSQKSNPSLNRNSVDQLPPDYFTIGSPKDDVLRLQGEPQNRAVYNEVGEEVWNYPGGQVTFSIRTQTVTHLNNYANGLQVKEN